VPIAATTALRGIRDVGEVTAGQRVLINGAGGGVGSYAVQIAAGLGAEVTGVCSTPNVELVRSIGAAIVIDYTTQDCTGGRARYDVILDNVSSLPLSRLRGALTPKGILVLNGGGSPGHVFGPVAGILRAVVVNAFVSQRLRPLPSRQNRAELLAVTGLIEDGNLMPVVDRTYRLAETVEGLRTVEQGHARGKSFRNEITPGQLHLPHPGDPRRGEEQQAAGDGACEECRWPVGFQQHLLHVRSFPA